jgi:Asp-tRNA(Asn)/Glu-tRNA(Gln) amidotransferase A subunit family amidase
MVTKDQLHRLVDALPNGEIVAAQRFLEFLTAFNSQDPVLRAFLDAPYDDEPLTPEEAAAVDEARAEIARGEFHSWESVRAELFRPN